MSAVVSRVTVVALVAVILGPLAWPGYVLSYDMVFVPTQQLSWHLIAPADALPRAVPLDAAVALVNVMLPGWLLQRLALVAIIAFAAIGAYRLIPTERVSIRVIAAVGYVWTPYLAERLLIGHWALLCAYAALPWLVLAAIDLRRGAQSALPQVVVAAAAGCLTPTGGVITLAAVAVLLLGAVPWRKATVTLAAVAALNLPWLVASAVSSAGGGSDPAGVDAFAARAENWAGTLVSLAGTGGIWNRLTTPASRSFVLVPLLTVALVALAGFGFSRLRKGLPAGIAARLGWLGLGGFVLALLGTVPPGASVLRLLVTHVPGAGLLRDGQKFLIPYALLLILSVGCGVERVVTRLGREPGQVVIVGALILPLLSMPDLAWGGAGSLRPVSYPDDWAVVSRLVAARPGEVLPLPFAEYRQYAWNHGRVVIDPAPRYLPAPVITDDALIVDERIIHGENQRASQIRALLDAGVPASALGPEWVLVEGPGVTDATLAGLVIVYSGPTLTLYHNPSSTPPVVSPTWRRAVMSIAYLAAFGVALCSMILVLIPRVRRLYARRRAVRRRAE